MKVIIVKGYKMENSLSIKNDGVSNKVLLELLDVLITLNLKNHKGYDYLDCSVNFGIWNNLEYCFIDNSPSINITKDMGNYYTYFNSSLDGLHFRIPLVRKGMFSKSQVVNSLTELEDLHGVAYDLDIIRENDYTNPMLKQDFINIMVKNGWKQV